MAKGRPSYFDQAIKENGEEFLSFKSVEQLQRDARKRIFKDMAFGNIDYEKHGKYFTDPRFLEQLIIVSGDEACNHAITYEALKEYDSNHPGDGRVIQLLSRESRLASVYSIIYQHLATVKASGYNIAILTGLTSQIYQFAQDIASSC